MTRNEALARIHSSLIDSDHSAAIMARLQDASDADVFAAAKQVDVCGCRVVQIREQAKGGAIMEPVCANPRLHRVAICSRKTFAACGFKRPFTYKKITPPVGALIYLNPLD